MEKFLEAFRERKICYRKEIKVRVGIVAHFSLQTRQGSKW